LVIGDWLISNWELVFLNDISKSVPDFWGNWN